MDLFRGYRLYCHNNGIAEGNFKNYQTFIKKYCKGY